MSGDAAKKKPPTSHDKPKYDRAAEAIAARDEGLIKATQERARRRREIKEGRPPWRADYKSKEVLDRQYAVACWWDALCKTNNEAFLPLFFCESRYLVLKGGAGSGKSIFVGRKILERVMSEENHRWLVCRKVARTLRQSCFAQLCGQLERYYPNVKWKSNKDDMVITIEGTKSQIIFAGLDDTEKLKSIYGITGVWIEEASEIEESDFDELDRRLRDETPYYKQIILSFNPISVTHWLKRRFFDSPAPDVVTHSSCYLDNRFLGEDARKTLLAYKDSDPYQYAVYCLGEWGVTGRTVFNGAAIREQLAKDIRPARVGEFGYEYDGLAISDWHFDDFGDGCIQVYRAPEVGVPYCLGGDTAGDGSDSFVAQVIDNRTGEQVAVLRQTFDEDLYARQVYCLGRWYNDALVAIEVNFSTHPVRELTRLGYPRQFVRAVEDDYRGRMRHSYGFRTDRQTRPVMLEMLVEAFRDNIGIVVDRTTLLEMETFIRTEEMRAEAAEGAHDDCVMALAIAHYIRPYQDKDLRDDGKTPTGARVKWTKDMIEDWRNGTEDERAMMQALWGSPSL